MMKNQKKPTRGKLVKKLDSVFSQYIRLKYSNSKGMCQCYTCGEIDHYKNMQNGHFLSRSNYKYRRDEENCRVQNYKCNIILSGNYKVYTLKMIEEYGKEKIEEMLSDKQLVKITTAEIQDKIAFYGIAVEEQLLRLGIKPK